MLLNNNLEKPRPPILNKRSKDFYYNKTKTCFNAIIRREEKE